MVDFGAFFKESVDYPDFAHPAASSIEKGDCELGILICGSGNGMQMAANKHDGIRAALCTDVYSAIMSRRHNDANVLAMGGRVTGFGPAGGIVRAWIRTEFEGGRHARRIEKTMALEEQTNH